MCVCIWGKCSRSLCIIHESVVFISCSVKFLPDIAEHMSVNGYTRIYTNKRVVNYTQFYVVVKTFSVFFGYILMPWCTKIKHKNVEYVKIIEAYFLVWTFSGWIVFLELFISFIATEN